MTITRHAMLFLAFIMSGVVATSPVAAASSARHYDCSKPGNANKAACKSAPVPSAAPAKAAKTTTKKTTTTTTTRHYDCTKKANANKSACRTAASETPTGKTPGAVTKTTKISTTTTDCTKWYNKIRSTCRTASSSTPSRTTVAPAPKPAAATGRASSASGSVENVNNNAAGAIAQCKDGSYSHAAHRSGACSRHGGVAKWL
jgi:hypothetical protein